MPFTFVLAIIFAVLAPIAVAVWNVAKPVTTKAPASVSNDPNVLVSRCLDLVNEAIKAGYSLPPGFSCFGSSSVGVIASGPAPRK